MNSELDQQTAISERLRALNRAHERFDLQGDETITGMFDKRVQRQPRSCAVVSGTHALSYAELDQLSRRVSKAVRPHLLSAPAPVAILASRHTIIAAAILGALRAGAFYVPLDPSFPQQRNAEILRASGAPILLTERSHEQLALELGGARTVLFPDELKEIDAAEEDLSEPGALAYVVFTSGSTGRPKGVMQTHRNVLQVARRYCNSLCVEPRDRISLLSSCSVTASVATLLGGLLSGATVCGLAVAESGLDELADWLDSSGITLYDSSPGLFRHLMKNAGSHRVFETVRTVRLVSDSMYRSDWEEFTRHFSKECILVNHYGCSEMSTVAGLYLDRLSHIVDPVVPVGFPLEDVEIQLLRHDGESLPVTRLPDVAATARSGEIVIRSRYLSVGYWKDPEATNAAFRNDETEAGMRIYRTGDLGAIRNNQGLTHLGRDDSQLKVSGFRVETADIEGSLLDFPGVREAAVLVRPASHGELELVGFASLDADARASGADIRKFLVGRLPPHMVPNDVLIVAQIPLTPNGKIDRSALTALREASLRDRRVTAAQTSTERTIMGIWTQLLQTDQLGVDDDFFEYGNSLLAMRAVSRVSNVYGISLDVRSMFTHPTIRQLASLVERTKSPGGEAHTHTSIA